MKPAFFHFIGMDTWLPIPLLNPRGAVVLLTVEPRSLGLRGNAAG